MKTLLSLTAVFLSLTIYGQVPQAFKYQATARDGSGNLLLNQNVSIRIAIIDSTFGGAISYQETHTTSTDQYGLLTLEVGRGVPVIGTGLSSVNWFTPNKWMQIEIDPLGGSNYTLMGLSEMLSVPYAFNAPSPDDDPTNELQSLSSARVGNNITISITGTNSTTFSVANNTGDNDSTNELNQAFTYNVATNVLSITDAGTTHSVDLQDLVNDAYNTLLSFDTVNNTLSIVDGGGVLSVDLQNLVNDAPWKYNGSDINYNTGNVGIGTINPSAKLQVANGDVYIDNVGNGVIMKSPNGNCWRVTVDNSGGFVSNAIPCA